MGKPIVFRKCARYQRPDGGLVRPMVIIEGHIMLRRPGCTPYVISMKEFSETYLSVTSTAR